MDDSYLGDHRVRAHAWPLLEGAMITLDRWMCLTQAITLRKYCRAIHTSTRARHLYAQKRLTERTDCSAFITFVAPTLKFTWSLVSHVCVRARVRGGGGAGANWKGVRRDKRIQFVFKMRRKRMWCLRFNAHMRTLAAIHSHPLSCAVFFPSRWFSLGPGSMTEGPFCRSCTHRWG